MKLITLLVVVAGVIALAQLAKVGQLTSLMHNKREEEISDADSRLNGRLWIAFMLAFYAFFIWLAVKYGDYAPVPASEHGEAYDTLMSFNLYIITAVFFLVNTVLFVFANRYRQEPGRKAKFFAHDNRLELIWTVIPSIVLAVIIIYGLRTWNEMTGEASEDALRVEVYSKRFDWTVRYPGMDGQFGATDYNVISDGSNNLGIVTYETRKAKVDELSAEIDSLQNILNHERGKLLEELKGVTERLEGHSHGSDGHAHEGHDDGGHGMSDELRADLEQRRQYLEESLQSEHVVVLSEQGQEILRDRIHGLERHRQRVNELKPFQYDDGVSGWEAGKDDIIADTMHLPVGREVEFVFRSRDVIHSAYMPHFRAQMNTVPGVPTRFKMTPTITTAEMRENLGPGNEDFNYVLLCNKVCGAAHYNMQMVIVVETEEEYNAWLDSKSTFVEKPEPEEEADEENGDQAPSDSDPNSNADVEVDSATEPDATMEVETELDSNESKNS